MMVAVSDLSGFSSSACAFASAPAILLIVSSTAVVQRRTAMKDEVVAKLDMREKQGDAAAGFPSPLRGEERCQPCQPFLAASQYLPRIE
jgi:hypothetical protein